MELKLRKLTEGDLETVRLWRQTPEVTLYMFTNPYITSEDQREWYRNIYQQHNCYYWIIEAEQTDIGLVCISNIDNINNRCNFGHYIANTSFRGKGIAQLVECNIYDLVFEFLNLNKLCFEVFPFNKAAIHIYKKLGAKVEGIRKQHIQKDEVFYDIIELGILKKDWLQKRKNFEYDRIEIE